MMLPRDFTQQEKLIAVRLTALGIRYEEQYFLDPYTVDFWVPSLGMVIEADGAYGHFKKQDDKRNKVLLDYPEVNSVIHIKEDTKSSVEQRLWEILA